MTKIAVITDIHANLPALEAAFAEIERLGAERIYCGGDLVRLRTAPERGLRDGRSADYPDHLRQLRLRDWPRPTRLRLRLRHPPRPTNRTALGRVDTRTPTNGRRTSCLSCPSTSASTSPANASVLCARLAAQSERVPVRRQTSPRAPPGDPRPPYERIREFVEQRLDAIRADRTAHQLRLERLLPKLIDEFEGIRSPDVIRQCADTILADYDHALVRSFALILAERRTHDCLREETRAVLS